MTVVVSPYAAATRSPWRDINRGVLAGALNSYTS
jgi:hypothetical protein